MIAQWIFHIKMLYIEAQNCSLYYRSNLILVFKVFLITIFTMQSRWKSRIRLTKHESIKFKLRIINTIKMYNHHTYNYIP